MQSRVLVRSAAGLGLAGILLACSPDAREFESGSAGSGGSAPLPVGGGGVGTSGGGASAGKGGGSASGGSAVAGSTATAGVGGSASSAGSTSSGGGGAAAGGSGGSVSTGGSTATAGSASGGAPPGGACPADATFCSGFEDTAMPKDAVYKVNAAPGEWTRDFAVDTTVMHGGKSSLRVKSSSEAGTSGSAYQMLAVPAPMATFWARFYIRQNDIDIGGVDHNVFAGASSSDEPNAAGMVEFAEDVGIAFNTSDDVRWPMNYGRINGATMPFSLPKGTWHCIEISFDSATREQKLFIDGMPQIDATSYPSTVAAPFKVFKLGFNKLHGPARAVWYDDVAVGPTRPGCL